MRKIALLCCLSAIIPSTAFADFVKVEVRDQSNELVAADVCLYNAQSGQVVYGKANDPTEGIGIYTFENLPDGQYPIVASHSQSGKYLASVSSRKEAGGPNPTAGPAEKIRLESGNVSAVPICKPKLTITSFVVNNKKPHTYSENIPFNFTINAQFVERQIDYCVAEGSQGVHDCRVNNELWSSALSLNNPSNLPPGTILPTYEGTHSLSAYRNVDLTLMIRYSDKSQTATPASASIYRLGLIEPAVMTGSVSINDDALATANRQVQVKWSAILADPSLKVDYCIKQLPPPGEPSADCHTSLFRTISPANVAGNVAEFQADHTLTGNPGMKTLSVQMRYALYTELVSRPGRDGIVLSEDIVNEFPCFAESLGVEGVAVENTSDGPVYVIPGGEAFSIALENGWRFTGTAWAQKGLASCAVHPIQPDADTLPDHGILVWSAVRGWISYNFDPAGQVTMGKCSYKLFGDQLLNPGWTFQDVTVEKRYGHDANGNDIIDGNEDWSDPLCHSNFVTPGPGSRSLSMEASLSWVDAPSNYLWCNLVVTEIRLRGPACADWRDAFVRPPSQ